MPLDSIFYKEQTLIKHRNNIVREFQLLTEISEATIPRCSFETVFWK